MDDLGVFVGIDTRGTGKSNPMRPDLRSVNDPLSYDYDSIFRSTEKNSYESSGFKKKSTVDNNGGGGDDFPVYDKPVYDDDIFEGLPGVKSNTPNVASSKETQFENDVFAYARGKSGSEFDDLLGNFGKNDKTTNGKSEGGAKGFDDLLPGLGGGSSGSNSSRPISESRLGSVPTAGSKSQPILDDPFMVFVSNSASVLSFGGTDPQEKTGKYNKSKSAKVEDSSANAAIFDDLDPLTSIGKTRNAFSPQRKNIINDGGSPPRNTTSQSASTRETKGNLFEHSQSNISEAVPVDIFEEPPLFDTPDVSTGFHVGQKVRSPSHHEKRTHVKTPTTSGSANPFGDIWLTVSEIPLFTQLSSAPPPSRPPPPVPRQTSRSETSAYSSSSWKKSDESSATPNSVLQHQSPKFGRPEAKAPPVSQFDENEEFSMGSKSHNSYDAHSSMDVDGFSAAAASAAAMKDAMDKAEAKFRHAKELRERENAKAGRSKESVQLEKDDEAEAKELRERHERLERERKQKEEEEREKRRLETEKEIRLREIERDRARQAVERATREARERAATNARLRAERSAVDKANAEARERAERVAVQRAQAEARERAAAEARERAAEKAAAEAMDEKMRAKADAVKSSAEVLRRAERAVFERVAAEARGRAATEARERASAAATKVNQKNGDDMESFFSMGRASSAPRARASATDPLFDSRFQNKGGSDAAKAPSSTGASSNVRKASSTTNFVDDLSSIFGAAQTGEFQEVDGESDERRRARLERQQRTQERAAKALAEKNQRDLQAQREQEERHRISDTLDTEIKRWAAGKEGNLRALLSTLQYVLWPECGWQPVSLTDLITGASVKKVYRKATLCIHPDKVQQKGATLQQKYIAEKVFDLLKESWNKFNSEELF